VTALHRYRIALQRAEATLGELTRAELARWATHTVTSAQTRLTTRSNRSVEIVASLGTAAADLSSLRQIGTGDETGAVIAIVGVTQAAAQSAPVLPAGLQESTVVVADFAGDSATEAAWQASLLQAGAKRVVVLTPATDDQLTTVVRQALDGAIVDTLTNVLFGLGQYTLSAAALPQLRRLLRLLTVTYPSAAASVIGYTDDLPTPGGNQRLSQLRAQAVADWLIARGVAPGRLQVFGAGDTDPVAPNTRTGQPLDRRVDVIIDPAVP
jgi:outer membrane protein OmpA-like peptidoglycan-associated protein